MNVRGVAALVSVVVVAAGLAGAGPAAAAQPQGSVTEFATGITAKSEPNDIVTGPYGNLWFASPRSDRLGRITPRGTVTEFTAGITRFAAPLAITSGPDGNLWFTEARENQIGRITPAGVVTEFPAGGASSHASDITAGPDGNLWFVKSGAVGRISPDGLTTAEFTTGITRGSLVSSIAAGPDGNLWFTEYVGNRIGRITPAGVVTEFSAGISPASSPSGIAAGPDGNLWFTEFDGNRIGRITTSGVVSEFTGLPSGTGPRTIAPGPDGNLWFTEDADRIGRITPAGVVTEFSAGISAEANTVGIAAGPDGNVWFTEAAVDRIGRIGTDTAAPARPSMTCRTSGGIAKPRLKVVCQVAGVGPSARVKWKVTRKAHGTLVARGKKSLVAGKLVVNLTHVDVHRGRHRVTVTKGTGASKVVLSRVVRVR